jgi:D-amino-acid dehydrogenase
MSSLREQLPLDYDHVAHGSLRIFRSELALQRTLVAATQLSAAGVRFRVIDRKEAVTLNPALTPIADQLAGAIHYDTDETGDAFLFCTRLADHARQLGVTFRLDTEVTALESKSGKIVAAASATERFVGDTYIICAGSYSARLLRHLGFDLPIRPAKGYSVSFDTQLRRPLPIPIVDDELHAVIVTLGDTIRVAGTAEFAGYDTSIDRERVDNLVRLLRRVLPEDDFDMSTAKPWCGLRPMSADGVPIIGATAIPNLFVNAGHGHLGWTMATGSARLLVDMLSGSRPEIDPAPYALARFQ